MRQSLPSHHGKSLVEPIEIIKLPEPAKLDAMKAKIESIRPPQLTQIPTTGAAVAGSREAFSSIVRHQFGRPQEEKNLQIQREQLRVQKRLLEALRQPAVTVVDLPAVA